MTTRFPHLGFTTLVFVALLLGACSGDDDVATGDTPADETDGIADQSDLADEGDSADGDVSYADFESPIQVRLGFPSDPQQQQDFFNEQERVRQQFVVECMAEQGFEYVAVDYSQFSGVDAGAFDERSYVEEFGFGISTQFLQNFETTAPEQEFVDPNQAIVEAMSESELEAYHAALYGDQSFFEPVDGEPVEITPEMLEEQGGCFNESNAVVGDPSQEFYTEFSAQFEDLYERLQADPRIVAANESWSSCMADAGHPYDDMEEMYSSLSERMEPFYELAFPSDFSDSFSDSFNDSEGGVTVGSAVAVGGPSGPPELTDAQQAELEELQALELAVAAANYECNQDVLTVQFEVQAEYEQRFLDENEAAIDALLAD